MIKMTAVETIDFIVNYLAQNNPLSSEMAIYGDNLSKLLSLNEKWAVLAEPIQTMLRKYGIPDAYDTLKELTRGKDISKEDIRTFIETLTCLLPEDKLCLLEMTPASYVGYAERIARE